MSDGGYRYAYLVDLPKGTAKYVDDSTTEAVSADGVWRLRSSWNWVDGYKQRGAEKLCKLELVRLRDGKTLRVGPKLMTCEGACFVPGG